MQTIATLTAQHARTGQLDWIGLRPTRHADMAIADTAELTLSGLTGDHRNRPGKRAVTLIQAEHLPVIAALANTDAPPQALRRNLVIAGINLQALRGKTLAIGPALVRLTTPCAPCSRMQTALGPGGYNAMRGHGGWCAEVLTPGQITVGDAVQAGPD